MSTSDAALVPDWRELYRLAVFETDPFKLPLRISNAQNAILSRVQENLTKHGDYHEHQELRDAVNGLHILQQEYLRRIQLYGEPPMAPKRTKGGVVRKL